MQIDVVIDRLRALPEEKQREVFDFVEFLSEKEKRARELEESRQKAMAAVDSMQRRAAELGLDQMTMEEIDEEIRQARAERRARTEPQARS